MKRFFNWHVGLILLIALFFGVVSAPPAQVQKFLPASVAEKVNFPLNLGLDLKGGTQLDYKIDVRKIPAADRDDVIQSVKEVIERRVNEMGVAEPNISLSKIGDEHHLTVELAGVDIKEAKERVGKTIQLEFKEEKTELDPNEKQKVIGAAQEILNKIKATPAEFKSIAEEEQLASPERYTYVEGDYLFKDKLRTSLREIVPNMQPGAVYPSLIEISAQSYTVNEQGNIVQEKGTQMVKLIDKREAKRFPNFNELVTTYSQDPQKEDTGGVEIIKENSNDVPYKDIALSLKKRGDVHQEPIETPEGYIVLALVEDPRTDRSGVKQVLSQKILIPYKGAKDADESITRTKEKALEKAKNIIVEATEEFVGTEYKIESIVVSTQPDPWKETRLNGQFFKHADVRVNQQTGEILVGIQFNEEGGKLFEELTEKNIGKRIAIFVGGTVVSQPMVRGKIVGNDAVIEGFANIDEASFVARNLNTGAIGAPIVLKSQLSISSTLGEEALQQSLKAGIIGLALLAIFMVLYYRLLGIVAVIALSIYSVILLGLIKITLPAWLAISLSIIVFLVLTNKVTNSQDSGWEKLVSFIVSIFVLFLFAIMLQTPVTLTLAGVAGVILSIGIAVDANVLIFERMKEEMNEGHGLDRSIDVGFTRAWSSIRDSNFSTLITCVILMWFGSSIIRGFAFNLAMGVLVSMFSAITITRTLLKGFIGTKLGKNKFLMCAKTGRKKLNINFLGAKKVFYSLSAILFIGTIVAWSVFGVKLGRDFTGGTEMQIKFTQEVTQDAIAGTIAKTEGRLNEGKVPAKDETNEPTITAPWTDFGAPTVVSSENNIYLIKLKHVTEQEHTEILADLTKTHGEIEEVGFRTVGPSISAEMQKKATWALSIAAIMIVLYVAFAFRKVPRAVNPWRFGVTTIIAVVHDLVIVFGVYILIGHYIGIEIDTLFVTALLTILGYSVNDTIVVFDRLRENLKKRKGSEAFDKVANISLNETLNRSINTSISTLLPLTALFILGGISIKYFVLALIVGAAIGTYSSIFIATAILTTWKSWAESKK